MLPEAAERLRRDLRQRQEGAVGREGALRDQGVDVRVPVDQLPEGLDPGHDARHHVVAAEHGPVYVPHRLPGSPGKAAQQLAVIPEEQPEALGDREDELAVGHGFAHLFRDVHPHQDGPLLVATRADAALAAGEADKELVLAIGAANAGEALVQVAAGEEGVHRLADRGPERAVAPLVALGIDPLERVEMLGKDLVDGRVAGPARAVEPGGGGADHGSARRGEPSIPNTLQT